MNENPFFELYKDIEDLNAISIDTTNPDDLAEKVADIVVNIYRIICDFSIEDKVLEKAEEKIESLKEKLKNDNKIKIEE